MFEIEYKGANSLVISTKKSKIVVDPNLSIVGLKNVSTKDAVELLTEDRFGAGESEAKLVINSPGEYGVSDFDIYGISAQRHIDTADQGMVSTMYRIKIGDIRIGIIGNIDEHLSDEQLESMGVIDILIIPVGGAGYTLDATSATNVIHMINPKVVIPVHYNDPALKYEVPQNDLNLFIAEVGAPVETVSKYKVNSMFDNQKTLSVVEIKRS